MLNIIRDTVQEIAEAIKAAFQMDVEIVNQDIVRIAATGDAKPKIGSKMAFGTISRDVIQHNKHIFIENSFDNPYCQICNGKGICTYSGGLVVPILYDQTVIGTLNIVAYNEKALRSIKQNLAGIIDFLYRMAELMTSKIREHIMYEEQNRMNGALTTLINTLPKGIISINEKGFVNQMNHVAEKTLTRKYVGEDRIHIGELFEDFQIDSVLLGKKIDQIELTIKNKIDMTKVIGDIEPIKVDDQIKGAVIFLSDYKEVQRSAFKFINSAQVISIEDIIGKSQQMLEIKTLVEHVAKNNSTILITGESGTGKELFARAIHQESNRKSEPFISINCGALPETLIESELFGYEKGAFTGADSKGKPGKFELADQGTIFLDEIGTMPLYLQVKLLRVLQTREVDKIGGKKPIPINVRILAATNENLEQLVDQGKFREDLYYRLNVIPIHLPPLRERKEDIQYLSRYFIRRYNRLLNRTIQSISDEVLTLLQNYRWPGNIRELENCLEYAINMTTTHEHILHQNHMPPYLNQQTTCSKESLIDAPLEMHTEMNKQELEMLQIKKLLEKYGRSTKSKEKIAAILGVSLGTLYRKIKLYNINHN
jgi:transcriptional regulator with PAS, ATPase and Fis domain